ncbi:nodulin-related protein 1-like [Prosopis cineraria]|uniref:nodulin-related protein 1-like n=1 Tax=Prosopis cineraria TaxID=364024 RepID=UPI00240FB86A|nr:nodulin-related protein 1-like [Prosopis cineraria]
MDSDHTHLHGHSHQQHSSSELLSSAKLVAQAAQSTFRHESHKVDKTQVANAAGDLLEAACHYGKLEDKSFGKYVDKAEDYLHKYGGSSHNAVGGGHPEHPTIASSHSAKPDKSHGHGDYLKMAQGFLGSGSKADSDSSKPGHSGNGGGYEGYLKLAQGLLKK